MYLKNCWKSTQKDLGRPACIPYLSEYSDCSEYTSCRGCNQCRCNAEGQWVCYKKRNTCADGYDEMELYEDGTDDNLVGNILNELAQKERQDRPRKGINHRAPLPEKRKRVTESPVIGVVDDDLMKEVQDLLRGKRSVGEYNETRRPIKFHHTIDEINEDTLKTSNISGTLGIRKVDVNLSGRANRRSGVFVNSTTNPLHIDYNQPSIYNNHITDNKIESAHNVDKYDALVSEKLRNIVNFTQSVKDKDLSKLVVNELKRGSETIGDAKAPVTSNITFTPEKDTLTAMAFIAGNLLNKLWNLERDTSDDSIEIDNIKHQKIADLLELFKEPLSYRQEIILKDALEQISLAVKNKDNKGFSLCETVGKIKDDVVHDDKTQEVKKEKIKQVTEEESTSGNTFSKLTDILDLMKKYGAAQTNLHNIRHPGDTSRIGPEISEDNRTEGSKSSLNIFGNILKKITDLLLPNKKNKIRNKIKNQNILRTSHHIDDNVKKAFNIDLDTMKLTSADKLILDYLSKTQMKPCQSSNLQDDTSIPYKESNILLNLSEFFKIKSYSDLLKLVDPVSKSRSTTPAPTTVNGDEIRRTSDINLAIQTENHNTSSINDKIKVHLKAIVKDLIELQNAKGQDIKSGDINIASALPCIFNMLNQEKEKPKATKYFYTNSALLNKIKMVLEAVKKDLKSVPVSRRSNTDPGTRPKSALVWERLVKNLDQNPKSSRRFFKVVKPQSYETVKKIIEYLETNKSNAYKSIALHKEVPVTDKLLFFKTLSLDTGNYANALGKLLVLNHEKKIPDNELEDVIDFVNGAIINFELNAKVIRGLDETKKGKLDVMTNTNNQAVSEYIKKNPVNYGEYKASSEQAMNQLIKNRVTQYLKMKESEGATQDMGYDIAQRILSNLERGSDRLARELYKILIGTSRREKTTSVSKSITRGSQERSAKLEDPTNKQWATEDMFLKTLESAWANILTV